jgi:DNA-binding response OmpR family regulator
VRTPQLLICERDREQGPLLALLRERALAQGWWLREVQDMEATLRLLRDADPGVLVLEVGRQVPKEFALVQRVKSTCPGAAVVVVGYVENVALSNLAWDLGADYVLFPPLPPELLPDVVAGLMRAGEAPS